MPIYEYACADCNGQFQKLVAGFSDPPGLACPRCGNTSVRRAISQVAVMKSEDARIEDLSDPATFAGLDENDPRSIARWARKMGKQLGDDAGEDWDEMVDQMLEEELAGDEGDDEDGEEGDEPRPKRKKTRTGADDLGWG